MSTEGKRQEKRKKLCVAMLCHKRISSREGGMAIVVGVYQ